MATQTQTQLYGPRKIPLSDERRDLLLAYRAELEEECKKFKGWSRWPWRRRKERKFRAFIHKWFPNASDKKKNYLAKQLAKI